MPLTKSKGNMYSWCSHTHSHLAGECPHRCSYCYVQAMARRFPDRLLRAKGELRLIEEEFAVRYGSGKTIFVEHMNDLFAEAVPTEWIHRILGHCVSWPSNVYVFQTKDPERLLGFLGRLPSQVLIGTTIESNRWMKDFMGNAPIPMCRASAMIKIPSYRDTFVTIEPIIDFDLDVMLDWMEGIRPLFVNIGADSKGSNLPEPSADKILALIDGIKALGIEIRQKSNLERLLNA